MIEFQQSQALTSHFDSFWSIVALEPFIHSSLLNTGSQITH